MQESSNCPLTPLQRRLRQLCEAEGPQAVTAYLREQHLSVTELLELAQQEARTLHAQVTEMGFAVEETQLEGHEPSRALTREALQRAQQRP